MSIDSYTSGCSGASKLNRNSIFFIQPRANSRMSQTTSLFCLLIFNGQHVLLWRQSVTDIRHKVGGGYLIYLVNPRRMWEESRRWSQWFVFLIAFKIQYTVDTVKSLCRVNMLVPNYCLHLTLIRHLIHIQQGQSVPFRYWKLNIAQEDLIVELR